MTKVVAGALTVSPVFALMIWDEVALATPIILLVNHLGIVWGYVAFCTIWAVLGLLAFTIWPQVKPMAESFINWLLPKKVSFKRKSNSGNRPSTSSLRNRVVFWFAKISRFLGVLAAAILLGPVLGWAVVKVLGFSNRFTYGYIVVGAWLFGAIWVPFYGVGGISLSRFVERVLG